jgi:hypothetical protein
MPSRRHFVIGLGSVVLPLRVSAQAPLGTVRELSGQVTVNDYRATRQSALQAGQTLRTGADGRVSFTIGADAFFLRPNSSLRLDTTRPGEAFVNFLRLLTGALGATFQRGAARAVSTPTSTIGIRGTGVYVEAAADWTYACTCFGATDINGTVVSARNHQARLVRSGMPIAPAGFERHSNEEMVALEALVGRPDPFKS